MYGYANVRFAIANTVLGNVLYFCAWTLLLNRLLYYGRFWKLAFYTALLSCSMMMVSVMLFPLGYIFGNDYPQQLAVISALSYGGAVLRGALMEYAGWRLQSLRCNFPPDMCCVLSNVLDNAIEAAVQTDEKWIETQAFVRQGQLVITIRNSCHHEDKPCLFSSRAGRSYGLVRVRRVVEQYGGTMEISANGCFTFGTMLPL